MDRASERGALDRRTFLAGAAALALWPSRALAQSAGVAPDTAKLLETSEFVYVSPLLSGGTESTCHGEAWYAWLDGQVVVNSRRKTWKVKAVEKGLDRARIWVGDFGRWKQGLTGARNEKFREGPSFEARAAFTQDRALLDRFLDTLAKKYPDEFGRWREDMQTGVYSGQRKLILYTPI
jgi:hypothetical protein